MFFRRRIPLEPVTSGSVASRHDFLDSIRILGAKLDVPHRAAVNSIPCEMQRVSLSVPRETWERVLGPPENINSYYAPDRKGVYHTWEHRWVGGSVTYVGCLFERTSDCQWLLLYRVLFFENCDMRDANKPKPHSTRCRIDFHSVPSSVAEVGEQGCQGP